MKNLVIVLTIIFVTIIAILMIGPFFILNEGQLAVVTQFGKIMETYDEAGLKWKAPIVDTVIIYPKKILSWDGDPQRIPTKENQFIWVDTTARWRITNPALFYESLTSLEQGYSRLDDIIDSSVRTVISTNPLEEAVRNSDRINESSASETPITDDEIFAEIAKFIETEQKTFNTIERGRRKLSEDMLVAARKTLSEAKLGIEVIDIVIRQIRYSDDLTESVYSQMIKDRNQVAQAYRSFGEGKKQELFGKLENDQKRLLSEAYATAEEIKGIADANATKIYAEAYNVDKEFYEFWKAIESYRKILPKFKKTLTTDLEYFKFLYSPEGNN